MITTDRAFAPLGFGREKSVTTAEPTEAAKRPCHRDLLSKAARRIHIHLVLDALPTNVVAHLY